MLESKQTTAPQIDNLSLLLPYHPFRRIASPALHHSLFTKNALTLVNSSLTAKILLSEMHSSLPGLESCGSFQADRGLCTPNE